MQAPPVNPQAIGCGLKLDSEGEVIGFCTRLARHAGSHMVATATSTIAIWDDDLTWTAYEGWDLT